MYASSQWFAAQALSSIRHGMGSRVAFAVARRAKTWIAARRSIAPAPLTGLTVAVSTARALALDVPRGCTLRVVSGQLWITAEGHSPAPDLWECYVAGPESNPDPANWRTELNRPLVS